jgi:chromosome partitioning protein
VSKILAVGCPKGGVGKTTSAITLAAIAAKLLKLKVLVVDGDDNHSSINWYSESSDADMPFDVAAGNADAAQLADLQISANYDLSVVDLAGTRTGGFEAILRGKHGRPGADFLLMPCLHGTMDLDALPPVIAKEIPPALPYTIVLTRVKTVSDGKAADIRAQLREENGWSFADTIVHEYAIYEDARGRHATVLDMPGKHSYARSAEYEYVSLAREIFPHFELDADFTPLEERHQELQELLDLSPEGAPA